MSRYEKSAPEFETCCTHDAAKIVSSCSVIASESGQKISVTYSNVDRLKKIEFNCDINLRDIPIPTMEPINSVPEEEFMHPQFILPPGVTVIGNTLCIDGCDSKLSLSDIVRLGFNRVAIYNCLGKIPQGQRNINIETYYGSIIY